MQPTRKINPGIAALIVIVLVGIVAAVVVVVRNQSESSNVAETSQTQESDNEIATAPTDSTDENVSYKNGTYTETGSYISPGGRESVEVTLNLTDDIITDATVTANAASSDSKEHQDNFIAGYKPLVIGKDIDEVSLSRVAGSSLTSNGFNAAVELIKADAKA